MNKAAIQGALLHLARGLSEFDSSTSLSVFGSAARGEETRDIDILLLGDRYSASADFAAQLKTLRKSLLAGFRNCGFATEPGATARIFESTLRRYNAQLRAVFIFGPCPRSLNPQEIQLHVKGPMNKHEFGMFCHEMPFHAYSVLTSAVTPFGRLEREEWLQTIHLCPDELAQWIAALEKRVERYSDPTETARCARKLLLHCEAYALANDLPKPLVPKVDGHHGNFQCLVREMRDIFMTGHCRP